MRLWHEALIPHLTRQQLLGQHRDCCALRGNGWGKPHVTVNYVFDHPYEWLFAYHYKVLQEMFDRGYCYDTLWQIPSYRGKHAPITVVNTEYICEAMINIPHVYPEHDDEYLKECLYKLASKGIFLGDLEKIF